MAWDERRGLRDGRRRVPLSLAPLPNRRDRRRRGLRDQRRYRLSRRTALRLGRADPLGGIERTHRPSVLVDPLARFPRRAAYCAAPLAAIDPHSGGLALLAGPCRGLRRLAQACLLAGGRALRFRPSASQFPLR